MAKLLAADASWEAADVCLQTHGGLGFAEEYVIERKFRETRLYRIAPVSTNLILPILRNTCLGFHVPSENRVHWIFHRFSHFAANSVLVN